jgi:hypothetical protein
MAMASRPRPPQPEDLCSRFSPDYATARDRFRAAARRAGARLDALALAARSPEGEALTIDIARLGAGEATHVLLHTSGIHGVEAYAGSAIQIALLDAVPALAPHVGVVLVHVLNPYGMAWLRRTNENNVDLNRNFLAGRDVWSGAPPLYRTLDPLLNPSSPPRRDAFALRLAVRALRHGYAAVKQAIAQGQYEHPRGLFYGGAQLEEGPRVYLDWLARNLQRASAVLALDVHTGLGPRGRDTLLLEAGARAPAGLDRALGRALVAPDPAASAAYAIRGGLAEGVRRALAHATVHGVVQEFGTSPPLAVLGALRDENRAHCHGGDDARRAAKSALREALCPADKDWRTAVVSRGVATARGAIDWLTEGEKDGM